MSYGFTAYFNDEGIASTEIYNGRYGVTYNRDYGDAMLHVTGFDGNMRFTATPESGYSFSRWVYHVGTIDATTQYSYSNPFTYTAEQDIWIRAESSGGGGGGGDDDVWDLYSISHGKITADSSIYFPLDPFTTCCAAIQFGAAGTAIFTSNGDVDVIGFLSRSSSYDPASGDPTSYLTKDDDSGDGFNFSFEYEVSANTTYYLWVHAWNGYTDSQVTISIIPPGGGGTQTGSGLYVYDWNRWVKVTPYVYNNGWKKVKPCLYSWTSWITGK